MATKNFEQLQQRASESIHDELTELKAELEKKRFDHWSIGLENPADLNRLRKSIARLNTELRAREISDMTAEELSKRDRIRLRRR